MYPGFEEYRNDRTIRDLGKELRYHLGGIYGPCWVSNLIWDQVLEAIPAFREIVQEREPSFEFGGIDVEAFEDTILGELVIQTTEVAQQVKKAAFYGKREVKVDFEDPDRLMKEAVDKSLKQLSEELSKHYESILKVVKGMKKCSV